MSQNLEPDQIWTSPLNQKKEFRDAFRDVEQVRLYDTTLRDGEQTVGTIFTPDEKVEIAQKISDLGVARIEAGFPRVSAEDRSAFERILKANLAAEIWGFSRAVKADLDILIELETPATVIEVPTSNLKLEAYGLSQETVVARAREAIGHAKDHGMKVAFFTVDGTRTEPSFVEEIYRASVAAGADEVVVADTIGACSPETVEFLVSRIVDWVGPAIPVHFHGHNDFGLATASAVAAVRGGARWIQGTINGMGERAGNADLAEIALALECLYGVAVEIDLSKIREVSQIVQKAGGYQVDAWKPVVGNNLFVRESGAVASQFHIPQAIEPFSAQIVGAERQIVLGKKSGLASIDLKCQELGLEVQSSRRPEVLEAVKRRSVLKGGLLSDAEFRKIVSELGD